MKLLPTYEAPAPVPLFLLRRRLRAAFKAAEHEFRLARSYLTHDGLNNDDAWCSFEISYFNLRQAEQDYLDTVIEPAH